LKKELLRFPLLQGGQPRSTNDALLTAFPFPATAGHKQKKYKIKAKSRAFYVLNNEKREWAWTTRQRHGLRRKQGTELP